MGGLWFGGGTGSAWGAIALTSTGVVSSGSWHHVLVTSNSGGSKAYIDGELVGSGLTILFNACFIALSVVDVSVANSAGLIIILAPAVLDI